MVGEFCPVKQLSADKCYQEKHKTYFQKWPFSLRKGSQKNLFLGLSPKQRNLQSGRSSLAKHGGAYFSAVYGFMKDPIAAPGPYENQEC